MEKHWSTAHNCGRLHKFGGLKPQNNQRFLLRLATTRQDRVKPINNMYETKQNRGHSSIQFITPWSSFPLWMFPFSIHVFFLLVQLSKQDYLWCFNSQETLQSGVCLSGLKAWLVYCTFSSSIMQYFHHVGRKSHSYFPCKFTMFPTIWILFVVVASIP